jgi:hypothetical protein
MVVARDHQSPRRFPRPRKTAGRDFTIASAAAFALSLELALNSTSGLKANEVTSSRVRMFFVLAAGRSVFSGGS